MIAIPVNIVFIASKVVVIIPIVITIVVATVVIAIVVTQLL